MEAREGEVAVVGWGLAERDDLSPVIEGGGEGVDELSSWENLEGAIGGEAVESRLDMANGLGVGGLEQVNDCAQVSSLLVGR